MIHLTHAGRELPRKKTEGYNSILGNNLIGFYKNPLKNKRVKMADDVNLGPLYKRMHGYDVKPWTYKCTVSGQVCERVTKHFQDYVAFVKRMSDTNDNGIFLIHEPNLCVSCWIYENELKHKYEIAKLNKQIENLQQQNCR